MKESLNNEKGKKIVNEVKTFPVPFISKERISIPANTKNGTSKEKIVNQAFKFHKAGQIVEATKYYKNFINQGGKDYRVFSNYGNILRDLGKLKEAELLLRKATRLNPKIANNHYNLGNILIDLGKLKEAELSTRIAIDLKPNFAQAYYNLGNILREIGKLKEAELSIQKAIKLKPDYAQAYFNLGNILREIGKLKEAELSIQKAIKLKPDYAQAYSNLGIILRELGKLKEAEFSIQKAIELKPDYAQAYSNLGIILYDLDKLKESEINSRKAIEFNPELSSFHLNLGTTLSKLGKLEEAAVAYQSALEKNPNNSKAIAELIMVFSELSSWHDVEKYLNYLSEIDIKQQTFNPMKLSHIEDDPSLYLQRALNFHNKNHKREPKKINFINKHQIHIGYFSADFREHPIMFLLSRILELHDNERFRVYIYSFAIIEDQYTQKLKKKPFIFRNIYGKSDLEAVEIARNDQLDIAIDLMGTTENNRMNIFSYRVSPIQICYLCSTTGSTEIDYLISDKIVTPKKFTKYYSEKIIYMPDSFMCFSDKRSISTKRFTRKEFNLPNNAFVLAAFHRNRKITLKEIDSWSRILLNISNAVIWISSTNQIAEKNILKAFKERGIKAGRILFAPKMKSNEEHLSRHSCADLFIDTFSWNANSTSIDSLWAGLPVVTLLGKSFMARTSASLLTTLGLAKLIANTTFEYENIIINLSKNPIELREIKNKLLNSKYKNPLFNSKQITKNLERVYCNLINNLKS